jgi:sec-independent protein translocase protein TatA
MLGGLGMGEMIVIFMVVLLLFGAKRLPEIGSSLGKGIREFKGSMREIQGEVTSAVEDRPKVNAPSATTSLYAPAKEAQPVMATSVQDSAE